MTLCHFSPILATRHASARYRRVIPTYLSTISSNVVSGIFFNCPEVLGQIFGQTKQGVALGYGLCANFSREIIQTAKEICVNLLQGFHLAHILVSYKFAFPKGISLLAALYVNGVLAVLNQSRKAIA